MSESILQYPNGSTGRFPDSQVARREIDLGPNTINSCNIAVRDIDGDGRDEIAIPITRGERDLVRLYRGDGSLLWENADIRFYHAYYSDPSPTPVAHMWYRSQHRHLLTEIVDIDDDGELEVVVGDGPVYVLDSADGRIKRTFDLGGGVALWTILRPEPGAPNLLVGTVAHRTEAPHVVAVDATGREIWRTPTPGRAFCDCIRAGDLTGDGRPEIGFSVDDAGQFWMMDCDGRVLWTKEVRTAFGEAESHVDDFTIGRISPSGLAEGNQAVVVPGPNLLDCRGNLVWTQRQRLDHAQSARVAKLFPELPGQQVYSVDTYDLVAYLFSCDGELL